MKFAYIKLLKTLEKKIVKTKNIIDFDTYIDNPSNKQMYLLHEKNLKKSCRILLVGETQEELENIIAEKRIPDPKINDSDKIEDIMDTDDETDETSKNDDDGKSDENRSNNDRDDEDESDKDEEEVIKVQRKKLETKKKAVKRKMAEAIIDAHEKARASTSADTEDVVEINNPASTIEAPSHNVELPPYDIEEPPYNIEEPGHNIEIPPHNIEEPPLRLLSPNNLNLNNEANLTVGTKRSGLIYLGEGEWVSQVAYNKAKNQVKPSLFVTKLAYALWGQEQLANRSVAHIEGRENRPLLEENKKLVVINQFERYLRHRDKMTQTVEMKEVNAYLGRAIGGARKTIAKKKRKGRNNENDSDENN